MNPRILPCDRLRYAGVVAGLLAVYALLWGLDIVSRARGRGSAMPEGCWPWEDEP